MTIGNKYLKIYCQNTYKCNVEVLGTQTPMSLDFYQIRDFKLKEI